MLVVTYSNFTKMLDLKRFVGLPGCWKKLEEMLTFQSTNMKDGQMDSIPCFAKLQQCYIVNSGSLMVTVTDFCSF